MRRKKAYYIMHTLKWLVKNLNDEEKKEIVIVVFIADFDQEFRRKVIRDVKDNYLPEVESGLIQVIVAPLGYYPKMDNLIPLYGDKSNRVKWRSKQSLDYSFMYFYCAELGKYYVQLEDDVLTEPNYLSKMKTFIASKGGNWSTLEFGARGFIGMTYDSRHLKSLARFCRIFFWIMPVDWLFRIFNDIYLFGNSKTNILKPPVFKHIGEYSSLDGQVRKLEDIKKGAKEDVNHIYQAKEGNPAAKIRTSMREFVVPNSIEKPYGKAGKFWAKLVQEDDFIEIVFDEPQQVERILIASGSPKFPSDSLEDSDLLTSNDFNDKKCENYVSILKSKDSPMIDHRLEKVTTVTCIKLVINSVRLDDHQRKRWLIIREIAVFTKS